MNRAIRAERKKLKLCAEIAGEAPRIERELELAYDPEKPLFNRVRTCLEVVSNGMFSRDREHRRMELVCREGDARHDLIVRNWDEWVEVASSEKEGVLVASRIGSERLALGYCVMPDTLLPEWVLQHPSVLTQRRGGYWCWHRELCDLVYDMARFEHWTVPGVSFDGPEVPS